MHHTHRKQIAWEKIGKKASFPSLFLLPFLPSFSVFSAHRAGAGIQSIKSDLTYRGQKFLHVGKLLFYRASPSMESFAWEVWIKDKNSSSLSSGLKCLFASVSKSLYVFATLRFCLPLPVSLSASFPNIQIDIPCFNSICTVIFLDKENCGS